MPIVMRMKERTLNVKSVQLVPKGSCRCVSQLQTHQAILTLLVCRGSLCLQGVQVNHSVQVLQVWHPRPHQGDLWPQEFLGHHPSHCLHQNSVLERLELQSLLWDQGNLHG